MGSQWTPSGYSSSDIQGIFWTDIKVDVEDQNAENKGSFFKKCKKCKKEGGIKCKEKNEKCLYKLKKKPIEKRWLMNVRSHISPWFH